MNKPWKYKNWLIWPNTVLSNIDNVACDDGNIGVCFKGKKINECIENCKEFCGVGYFIELSNGDTICLPLDDIKYQDLSPYNLLVPQNTTNFKNMNISIFVNTDIFPFPPNDAGNIFYNDRILITSVENGLFIGYNNSEKINKSPIVVNEKKNVLSFLPVNTLDKNLVSNIPLNFNQKIILNVKDTDIILSSDNLNLIWNKILTDFTLTESIELIAVDQNKKNKKIKLGDKFKIKNKNMFVKISNSNNLILDKTGSIFEIKLLEKGYYCENKICNKVEINNQTLKKKNIGRRSDCFKLCEGSISDKPPKKEPNLTWLYIIIGIIILIIIIILTVKLTV